MRTRPSSCDAVSVIRPIKGLPSAARAFGRLDTVVDTVADQMGERIGQLFEDRLVELDIPADDCHLDLFAELPAEVANHPRKFPEQIANRLHPRPKDRLLKRGSDCAQALHDRPERTVIQIASQQRLVPDQCQLADQSHEPVEQLHVDRAAKRTCPHRLKQNEGREPD